MLRGANMNKGIIVAAIGMIVLAAGAGISGCGGTISASAPKPAPPATTQAAAQTSPKPAAGDGNQAQAATAAELADQSQTPGGMAPYGMLTCQSATDHGNLQANGQPPLTVAQVIAVLKTVGTLSSVNPPSITAENTLSTAEQDLVNYNGGTRVSDDAMVFAWNAVNYMGVAGNGVNPALAGPVNTSIAALIADCS